MATTTKPRRRTRPLRKERSDVLLFVTSRTIEERFWLHPLVTAGAEPVNRKAKHALKRLDRLCRRRYEKLAKQANARSGPHSPKWTAHEIKRLCKSVVGDALRRAQENNDVEIFALIAMSNHIHMVIRTPKRNCAAFLRDFKSMVAKHANRVHGRSGPLWARRADVQPILDDDAAAACVAYTIDNPRKANLVTDPEQWPGLSLCFGLGETDEVPFEYFDFKAWRKARRPDDKAPFFKRAALKLSPLPAADCTDRKAYAESVRSWLIEQVDQEQQDAQRLGIEAKRGATLGVETVIKAAFDRGPGHPTAHQGRTVLAASRRSANTTRRRNSSTRRTKSPPMPTARATGR